MVYMSFAEVSRRAEEEKRRAESRAREEAQAAQNKTATAALKPVGAAIVPPTATTTATPTMTALTAPATTQTATAPVNPYTGDAAKTASANYWQSLQPQMRKATDAVTSSVNPFMTGNVGASLLRDVQQPALQGLSQFETNQAGKAQDWEAQQITEAENKKQQNINNLKALAESPNATPQDIENYRAALAGRAAMTIAPPAAGTTAALTPAEKSAIQTQIDTLKNTDYAGNEGSVATLNALTNKLMGTTGQNYYQYSAAAKKKTDFAENEADYTEAVGNYENLLDKIPGWITDTANSNRASYQAYQELEDMATALSAGKPVDMVKFNKLLAAFKNGGMVGNYNEDVFKALGYGATAAGTTTGKAIMLNQNTALPNYPGMPGYNPGLPIKYF